MWRLPFRPRKILVGWGSKPRSAHRVRVAGTTPAALATASVETQSARAFTERILTGRAKIRLEQRVLCRTKSR